MSSQNKDVYYFDYPIAGPHPGAIFHFGQRQREAKTSQAKVVEGSSSNQRRAEALVTKGWHPRLTAAPKFEYRRGSWKKDAHCDDSVTITISARS
jgi:hypothetical protein